MRYHNKNTPVEEIRGIAEPENDPRVLRGTAVVRFFVGLWYVFVPRLLDVTAHWHFSVYSVRIVLRWVLRNETTKYYHVISYHCLNGVAGVKFYVRYYLGSV